MGRLENRFIELASSRTEGRGGDAAFLWQGQLQFLAVIPEIIDGRAVALRVFGRDQAEDQQHEHHGVDNPLALTPLPIVIGGHIVEDVGDLLPQRDERLLDRGGVAGLNVVTVAFLEFDGTSRSGQLLLPVELQRVDEDLFLCWYGIDDPAPSGHVLGSNPGTANWPLDNRFP